MTLGFDRCLDVLRAVAEPSRLRLLAILAQGEFSVTELTHVLGQSQPRVSRHLKLLGDAGLLEKFREQHWIYYRVPTDGAGRAFVDGVLTQLDAADAALAADRERVAAVLRERHAAEPAAPAPEPHELAAALARELGERGRGALLYVGPAPGVVLDAIAPRARRVVGVHGSRAELQRARARLHGRGLSHCVLQQGELGHLPHGSGEFDTVVIDRTLANDPRPVEALRDAARLLRAGGEALVAEDYDALALREDGANPLALLKNWLAQAGLACTRLHPFDLDGRHLVLALAHPGDAVSVAA